MIPSSAVKSYLARKLDSHLWVKKLTEKQLDAAIASLVPRPTLSPQLRLHQRACFLLGVSYPQFCFWLSMGCVDGETEYLSPRGWVKIKDYKSGKVAQYNPYTREATFVVPLQYVRRPCKEMVRFRTARGLDQMLSLEHNMLVVAQGKKDSPKSHPCIWKHTPVSPLPCYRSVSHPNPWFYKVSAKEMLLEAKKRRVSIETTFIQDGCGIGLTDAQIRVQVAAHADGHLSNGSKVVISVKKDRKKKRMRFLLKAAAIKYRERDAGGGYTSFRFIPPAYTKTYGSGWWDCTLVQKKIICEEVGHWDGSFGKAGGVTFFSRSKDCAAFIQYCFSSTGRRSYMNVNTKASLDGSGKFDYVVHAIGAGRTTNLANLLGGEIALPTDGKKYCFEVPTGYLVLRRSGNIFVTGNTGKTLLALELLRYWFQCETIKRALIFVTSDKAFNTWEKQFKQFGIDLPVTALAGSSEEKWKQLEEFGDGVVLIPYPGALHMVSTKVAAKKGKKKKLKLDLKKLQRLGEWAGALVLDESTKMSGDSLSFLMGSKLREYAKVRYALAGRPFGRDPIMLWAQHYLIDGGETLGETKGIFRAAFYTEKPNYWGGPYSKEYKFKDKLHPQLAKMIQHRSITYAAEECVDLPKVVPIREVVKFPEEAGLYYKRVVEQIIGAKGNLREMKSAFIRMRQISSGFVGMRNEEDGTRAEIEFDQNPKLERLLELIEEVPEGRGACIFYQHTWLGKKIVKELTALGHKPVWLWSGTKDARGELERFAKMRQPIAVLQNQVGSMSIDSLQQRANYLFFMESPLSVIDRSQAEARLVRQGQVKTVFIYDLLVEGTVDQKILDYHKEGESLFDALLRNPKGVLL